MSALKATSANVQTSARPSEPSQTFPGSTSATVKSPPLAPTIQRAMHLAERGDCQAALQLLRSHGQDRETLNAIGVCLMRLGQVQEAIKLYRTMVLMPGCTWMRPELPTRYKINFATALLLGGHPAGCLDMLEELKDDPSPMIERLHEAIQQWESTLGLWRWIDWRLCRVEPPQAQIAIDFPPGEFVESPPCSSTGC